MMKNIKNKIFFIPLFVLLFTPFQSLFSEPPKVTVVYPREGSKIGAVSNSFVFGSVSPSSASLKINGSPVPVYRTGSYLAMIPFAGGEFKIKAQVTLNNETAETVRTVSVSSPMPALPRDSLAIDSNSVRPSTSVIATAGDIVSLSFRGTPGCKAEYRFSGLSDGPNKNHWKPMTEKLVPVEGIYESAALIETEDEANSALVEFRLTSRSGKNVKVTAPGRIKIIDKNSFSLMEVSAEEATFRTGPSIGTEQMGYDIFLPKGVKLKVTGKLGAEVRAQFSDSMFGWTEEKNLKRGPDSAANPQIILETLKIQKKERGVLIVLETKEKVPYQASVSNDLKLFNLTLFYAVSNIDRIRYDTEEKRLGPVRWSQLSKDVVRLQFPVKEKVWGYDLRYEGNKLLCEIVFAPEKKKKGLPLNGWTVAVDPGHSPDIGDGTVSPQGVTEGEVNFRIASCLKQKLEKAGAKVVMTRLLNDSLPLPDRGRKAWQAKADLFVSVHTNAVPDGTNPADRRGFSIYYFQPQSFELAKSVHASYQKMLPTPDDGLYYGNLAVCRTTQMPAILTESDYLIHPKGEELLLSKEFQCRCADAMTEGIIQFVRSY